MNCIFKPNMAHPLFLFAWALALLNASMASAATVEHSFQVGNLTVERLCQERVITAVNGIYPGPTINVTEGDTLIVHVLNDSPYNLTLHWHGIFQMLSGWADGADYVTQCPITPTKKYTYRFKVTGQEGTLWWHAHLGWLRATVYGALFINPRPPRSLPFPTPDADIPIFLGEWWNANVVDVENEALASGNAPNNSDAYTINGFPGDTYPCSQNHTYTVTVEQGKTYLLRIVNAALNNQLFFMIAQHSFTVVAVDACYTEPYSTDIIVIAPGQTVDALMYANRSAGSPYYMAARAYLSSPGLSFDNTTTRGILRYGTSSSSAARPKMPALPEFNDTGKAHEFYSSLLGLTTGPFWAGPPTELDHKMFVTIGLGLVPCGGNGTCSGPFGQRSAASMNNESFETPRRLSMLEAFAFDVSGVYNTSFPDAPRLKFNYTDTRLSQNRTLLMTSKSTAVKRVEFNETVEMILQDTALLVQENHPMHIHGFNFHVVGQGFGNYDPEEDPKNFNLNNPQERNTIGVPTGGWAAIRFRANNPGVWMMHCHLDTHLPLGLATAFVVENGATPESTLPEPPADLPTC